MDHPDQPVGISYSLAGDIVDKPDSVISIVVKDQEGAAAGVLEKWESEAWIYAEAESLREINQ